MREIFTSGSVGGAPGNRCFYLERRPGKKLARLVIKPLGKGESILWMKKTGRPDEKDSEKESK